MMLTKIVEMNKNKKLLIKNIIINIMIMLGVAIVNLCIWFLLPFTPIANKVLLTILDVVAIYISIYDIVWSIDKYIAFKEENKDAK